MNSKLYVGNLPFSIDEASLADAFGEHGQVTKASIVTDRETGRPRGFAFVEMATEADAQNAIKGMDGRSMGGRQIQVTIARPREDRGSGGFGGGRGGGGGFGGGRGGGGGFGGGGRDRNGGGDRW